MITKNEVAQYAGCVFANLRVGTEYTYVPGAVAIYSKHMKKKMLSKITCESIRDALVSMGYIEMIGHNNLNILRCKHVDIMSNLEEIAALSSEKLAERRVARNESRERSVKKNAITQKEQKEQVEPQKFFDTDGNTEDVKISSRWIAWLMGKNHNHVLADIRDKFSKFSDPSRFFRPGSYKDGQSQERTMYLLTKTASSMLMARYEPEHEVKVHEEWLQFKSSEREQAPEPPKSQFNLPGTYEEALEQLLGQVKTNKQLTHANQSLEFRATTAESYVKKLDCSKGAVHTEDLAQKLYELGFEIGRSRMFAWMKEQGYMSKSRSGNSPNQAWIEKGYMTKKIGSYTAYNEDGEEERRASCTPLITLRGVRYFLDLFYSGKEDTLKFRGKRYKWTDPNQISLDDIMRDDSGN